MDNYSRKNVILIFFCPSTWQYTYIIAGFWLIVSINSSLHIARWYFVPIDHYNPTIWVIFCFTLTRYIKRAASLLRCAIEAFLSAPSALFIERLNVWKRITNVWQILSNQESVLRKSHTSSNNIEHDTHATRCEKLKKTPVSTSDNSYTSANKLEIVSFQL